MKKIDEIDFAPMYRAHFEAMQRPTSQAAQWDQRAAKIPLSWQPTPYVDYFVQQMQLQPNQTVLDVGCGAGDIALAVALRGHSVQALDFSAQMLERLHERAQALGVAEKITTHHLDWLAPWPQSVVSDVAVASRSTLVADMQPVLHKLHEFAQRRVVLSYPGEAGQRTGPDFPQDHVGAGRIAPYFYIPALLYQHGQWPELTYFDVHSNTSKQTKHSRWAVIAWQKQPWLLA